MAPGVSSTIRRRSRTRHDVAAVALAFGTVAACAITSVGAATDGRHPTLLRADGSGCSGCHAALIEDQAVVHPPVGDDCTTCHEVTLAESGTTIGLTASGSELCLMCHDDLEDAAGGAFETPHAPVLDDCANCHDPHAGPLPGMLAGPSVELCGGCHDLESLGESHGGQLTDATECRTCHDPHGSAQRAMLNAARLHRPFEENSCDACHRQPFGTRIRLRGRREAVCTSCHGEFEAPDGGSVHGALDGPDRRAGCLSCHDPHLASSRNLLQRSGPDLCATCHAEIVDGATAETGHAAAADDCLTCHAPHVAEAARLLPGPAADLCRGCHDAADDDLRGAHLGADLDALECLGCHDPHGAGNPKLLASTMHPPVLDGCDTCHEGGWDEVALDGGSELCLMCHDDIGEAAAAATVPHAALEIAACTACHAPHAAPRPSLVRAGTGAVCTDCHDDVAAGEGEVLHGVIEWIGCQACHEPHGGENPSLLRASGDELCLSCHGQNAIPVIDGERRMLGRFPVSDDDAARIKAILLSPDGTEGHPLRSHRVSGTPDEHELAKAGVRFEGAMSCMTCHDPHKGRSRHLFRWGAAGPAEACSHCHDR